MEGKDINIEAWMSHVLFAAESSRPSGGDEEEVEEESLFRELPTHTFKKADPIVFRHARRDGTVPDLQAIICNAFASLASDSLYHSTHMIKRLSIPYSTGLYLTSYIDCRQIRSCYKAASFPCGKI